MHIIYIECYVWNLMEPSQLGSDLSQVLNLVTPQNDGEKYLGTS